MAVVQVQPALIRRRFEPLWRFSRAWVVALVVAGCVAPGTPVVTDRSLIKIKGSTYLVEKGDTLYSIAWRFDMDHLRLAAANRIGSPFTIYPGQRLRISEQTPPKSANISQSKVQITKQVQTTNRAQQRTQTRTKTAKTLSAETPAKTSTTIQKLPKKPVSPQSTRRTNTTWHRPLPQKPDVLFGASNKGLDYAIASRAGVRAARSGKVVYAGNGIAGFERLIIVQHSSDLLSAYSFNGKMLVAEQQQIRGGAEIAQILPRPGVGQILHFELRRKGKPINPQTLIP